MTQYGYEDIDDPVWMPTWTKWVAEMYCKYTSRQLITRELAD